MAIDSGRYLNLITRQVMKAWASAGPPEPGPIPFQKLGKPLAKCKVALVSTAGIACHGDRPFDQEGERRNPWWGDPTYRRIPVTATAADVGIYHLHIDPRPGQADLDVLLPVQRLRELAAAGVVGAAAEWHYSTMGYVLDTRTLVTETAPAIAEQMRGERVDAAALFPA